MWKNFGGVVNTNQEMRGNKHVTPHSFNYMREDVEGDHKKTTHNPNYDNHKHTHKTSEERTKKKKKMTKMMYDISAGLFEIMFAVENDNSC